MTEKLIETNDPVDSPLDANGFIGVSPEYQNFANATDKPLGEGDDEGDDEVKAEDNKADDKKTGETVTPAVPAKTPAAPTK